MEQQGDINAIQGPFVYQNWLHQVAGAEIRATEEFPLYTDAHITGELIAGYGPYQFLNAVPIAPSRRLKRSVFVRAEEYTPTEAYSAPMDKTDVSRYHGGGTHEELAALTSLCLGIRVKAGSATRRFEVGGDPMGHPIEWQSGTDPQILFGAGKPIIPEAQGDHSLDDLTPLQRFPELSPAAAMALVRAARLYQDGLWIADSEPALAWVLFVSAVEVAAGYWREAIDPPRERLHSSRPDLEALLLTRGDDEFVECVADLMANYMGATSKFLRFLTTFMPAPPTVRPPGCYAHPWTATALKQSLKLIYEYRSQTLHGGTPFPLPMCLPPWQNGESYSEVLIGMAMSGLGGVWVQEDVPMLLHLFEYIVRSALLKWWGSMTPSPQGELGE